MYLNLQKISIPGSKGISIQELSKSFISGNRRSSITLRASAIAYNFFLALFPMIILIFTIIPYIPIHHFPDLLMENIRTLMPEHVFKTVRSTIDDIIRRPRGGLLSFGFIMTIYFSSNGINSIIDAFNKSAHTQETRKWIKQRMVCLILVLILSLMLFISITLISINTTLLHFLMSKGILKSYFTYYLILSVKWIILMALIYFGNSFLYYLGPAKSEQYKFFSPGSTLSTLLIIITSVGFNFYINNFSKYNALYGSIGTLIVLMIWIYLNALIVLVGYELNAIILDKKKKISSKQKPSV